MLTVEFDLATMANAGQVKLTLIQSSRGKPDTHPVVYKHFHPVSAAIGEQVSTVRLRRTERCDHTG
ncbi:hypothetical protein EMIT0P265_30667 [Pseudomonas zeae]